MASSSNPKNNIFDRINIHDILVDNIFSEKGGGNFTKMNGDDIEKAFNIYDLKVFNNQIRNKLQEDGDKLKFLAKSRTFGLGGICGVEPVVCSTPTCGSVNTSQGNILYEYYIDVAPNIVATLVKKEGTKLARFAGVEKMDRVYCFQLILEQEIIHLLMMLWNYTHRDTSDIYSVHGKLYRYMLNIYFGYGLESNLINLTNVEGLLIPNSPIISETPNEGIRELSLQSSRGSLNIEYKPSRIGIMENWANSCYIDSLLTSLFLGAGDFPREVILKVNVSKINYKSWAPEEASKDIHERKKKIFKKIGNALGMNTEKQTREYTIRLQKSLLLYYEQLTNPDTREGHGGFKCINTRTILTECIPEMRCSSKISSILNFCSYSVGDLYEILADLFPGLKMWHIPTLVNSLQTGKVNDPGMIEERKSFLFWDFVGPVEEEGVTPVWDKINSSMLVFQNGLIPPIEYHGLINPEKVTVMGPIPGKFDVIREILPSGEIREKMIPKIGNTSQIIKKSRIFEEFIIGKKYRLFAVIRNHGFKPTSSGVNDFGGGHYTAYIRPFLDPERWYIYDDIGPKWNIAYKGTGNEGKLPGDTFTDSFFARSELLFYQKV